MILVIEAGYHGAVAFSACSTLPVSTSTRICDSAAARDTPTLAVMQVASAKISVRPIVDSCKNITYVVQFHVVQFQGGLQGGLRNHDAPPKLCDLSNLCGVQMQNGTRPMHGSRLHKLCKFRRCPSVFIA